MFHFIKVLKARLILKLFPFLFSTECVTEEGNKIKSFDFTLKLILELLYIFKILGSIFIQLYSLFFLN
jgi:hypothetical protein